MKSGIFEIGNCKVAFPYIYLLSKDIDYAPISMISSFCCFLFCGGHKAEKTEWWGGLTEGEAMLDTIVVEIRRILT